MTEVNAVPGRPLACANSLAYANSRGNVTAPMLKNRAGHEHRRVIAQGRGT